MVFDCAKAVGGEGPPLTQSTTAGRIPDEPRTGGPGIAGPAIPKQKNCRQIIHFHGYGKLPLEPRQRAHSP